jgi:Fe-S-cluster containining protein
MCLSQAPMCSRALICVAVFPVACRDHGPPMFSPAVEKQRRQLYAQTLDQMERHLESVGDPADMLTALSWGMGKLEKTYAETAAKIRVSVACAAGCSHCCHGPVDVQAHEVFFAAEHIQLHFSTEELTGVIERVGARRNRVAGLNSDERDRIRQPCALLGNSGQCSIYAGRPEACRVHHTSDASVCAAHEQDPDVDLEAVYIPELRARMFAVMIGMDEAIEAHGFDDRSYDFGSALHEALTNSLCRVLWMRKGPAFPDSCLAPAPGTD